MNFQDFINMVESDIKNYLPEEYTDASVCVQVQEFRKTNDVLKHGLVVRKSNDLPSISPTIYLEEPYQEYENGADLKDIMNSLARVIVKNTGNCPVADISTLNDFEKNKRRIRIKLVNKDMNKDYLSDKIFTPVGNTDLVACYFIDLTKEGETHATVMITKGLFDTWNIDLESLHEAALRNTSDCASFQNIRSILSEFYGQLRTEFEFDIPEENDNLMYVLSSTDKFCGAASVLCPETMNMVKDLLKTDKYYILPASVNETLIVPYHEDMEMSVTGLKHIVEEVNASEVAETDLLSSNVYTYCYETHSLCVAA